MTPLPPDLFTPSTAVPPQVTFRLAQEADRRPLHATCYANQTAFQFRDLFNHLLRQQAQGRCFWLVVTTWDRLIGNGQLVIYPTGAECANLFVVPEYRGQGIGTALLGVLTAVACHQRITGLEIGVTTDNDRALALYQRLGFREDRRIHLPNRKPSIILHKVIG